MKVEIIAIAEEILKGMIVNTNSSYISSALSKLGWDVQRHTVLPDSAQALKQGLQEALERSDLVISTGGLGPTLDDITRAVAADLFSSEFVFSQEIADELSQRYGSSLTSLKDQATVPKKAHILKNRVGTAPGFVFRENKKILVLLPGVPPEMQPMLEEEALPYLQKIFRAHSDRIVETLHFCLINENMLDPLLRQLQADYPSMEFGIYPGYGTLSVVIRSAHIVELAAAKHRITSAFPTHVFLGPGKIEEALFDCMKAHKKTLSFAESCTGGIMAHKITSLAGASDFFLGSLVTYSNDLKKKLLNVSASTLEKHGAVSKEVVEEMLKGLFEVTGSDFGIAVSGIAGPSGGTKEKPVGTIWAAIGEKGKTPEVGRFEVRGTRQIIITVTATKLFAMLYRKLQYDQKAFILS